MWISQNNDASYYPLSSTLIHRQGLGIRMGSWMLTRGLKPDYDYIGTHREGCGGLWEQAYHQGYDSDSVVKKLKEMVEKSSSSSA